MVADRGMNNDPVFDPPGDVRELPGDSSDVSRDVHELPREVAAVPIPTPFGVFDVRAFQCSSGTVYLALIHGDVRSNGAGPPVLTRLHSECLTGDVLGSLRCDCGVQLRTSLRAVAAADRGVVLYLTGQEGRGIGLVNKLRAYIEQDNGADTVDANLRLGLAVDSRDYRDAAHVLAALGVGAVELLTNNPEKVHGLRAAGVLVDRVRPLGTVPHLRNRTYLRTKQERLGHRFGSARPAAPPVTPIGRGTPAEGGSSVASESADTRSIESQSAAAIDVAALIGDVVAPASRPYVVVKYAQTMDGRIATANGDSKWISGETERRIAHSMRAFCDAVLVGAGTVASDDPRLTVRMVAGASPLRVVLDSGLRTPIDAAVLSQEAGTVLITTAQAPAAKVSAVRDLGVSVLVAPRGAGGVDVAAALALLRELGVLSVVVEGGSQVITSFLHAGRVDRLVVSVSPTILGAGVEAVGELGVERVADGLRLTNRTLAVAGDDLLMAWDVARG